MITRLFASVLLVAGLSQAALAQNDNQQNQPSTSGENTQASPQGFPQSLRDRLASAGYSSVNIVRSSLVITAIDRGGRPVLMRVTPTSMFFLTPAISSSTGQNSDESAMQNQLSTTSEESMQASPQDAQRSITTGAARDSNDNAEQNQQSMSRSSDSAQASRDVPQSLRERLTSAGFTDVNIVPRSLLITARDRIDRPVMMRITPRSLFFVTEIPAGSSSTTGPANSDDSDK
jgi:fatty acid/phospholipid biosynthesis enzyme